MSIVSLANEMKDKERKIAELKRQLEHEELLFERISSQEMPMLMSEIGLRKFILEDGTEIHIQPVFKINTPKDKMEAIDQWLENNGHGGMVKTNINISNLRKEDIETLKALFAEYNIKPEVIKSINWQTLNAWGREMEREGMVIPEDLFSIFRSQKTVIR